MAASEEAVSHLQESNHPSLEQKEYSYRLPRLLGSAAIDKLLRCTLHPGTRVSILSSPNDPIGILLAPLAGTNGAKHLPTANGRFDNAASRVQLL